MFIPDQAPSRFRGSLELLQKRRGVRGVFQVFDGHLTTRSSCAWPLTICRPFTSYYTLCRRLDWLCHQLDPRRCLATHCCLHLSRSTISLRNPHFLHCEGSQLLHDLGVLWRRCKIRIDVLRKLLHRLATCSAVNQSDYDYGLSQSLAFTSRPSAQREQNFRHITSVMTEQPPGWPFTVFISPLRGPNSPTRSPSQSPD